jgi:membrane protease YdiL (CAAX protease family)
MVLQHILIGIIVIVVPILSIYEIRRLKTSQDPYGKIKCYLKSIAILWTITGAIWYISSPSEVFYFSYSIDISRMISVFIILFFIFFIVTTIVPLFLFRHQVFRDKLSDTFKERQFIFPVTRLETYLFGLVAVSVGICEEVIFRSFLVTYLYNLPLGLSITASFIAAGIVFGLGHFHQGANGVVSATIVGFLMSYMFIETGSLLLPMIVHAIYDMKILLLARIASTDDIKQKSTINEEFLEI